ncbi:hypothetical protein HRR95_005503 [Exophiala dermatitidis]|nr:hypothetical protein HRR95_005503 [Exophiala dermatitidis]
MSDIDADAAASFLDPPPLNGGDDEDDEVDSLPSDEPDSDEDTDDEDYNGESDAEREWKESLQQLELLLTMVIVPYMGKYFGRKFAYWGMSILQDKFYHADRRLTCCIGWKQFMEWKYPVEIVVTNKAAFQGVGAVEAAASL